MGVIRLTNHGSFKLTKKMLRNASTVWYLDILAKYADEGVKALEESTPKRTGKTSKSWGYRIDKESNGYSISWFNTNLSEGDKGPPVVVLLYYGHVTKRGYYIEGRDFITPAIEPIFKKIAEDAWKEMKNGGK